jgi:UDPglucose 6-dehydrogenase
MRNQNRIILGGPRPWINTVKQVFRTAFSEITIIKTSSTTAEMVKYLTNNFLTVKVAFANEIAQICEALDSQGLNIDYDKVTEYASYDSRIGKSHWNVPGPDGHRGYGGHCFPKDINAMIHVANSIGVDAKILKAAWDKNLEVRKDRDWEMQIGRAVSKKPNS